MNLILSLVNMWRWKKLYRHKAKHPSEYKVWTATFHSSKCKATLWVLHSHEGRSHRWRMCARNPPCVPEDLVPIHLQTPAVREKVSVYWNSNWTRKWLSRKRACHFSDYGLQFYHFLRQVWFRFCPFTLTGVLEGISHQFVMYSWNVSNQHSLLHHSQQTHLRSNKTLP